MTQPDLHDPVITTTENAVMTITLNRPKAINSLTVEMIELMQSAMDHAESNNAIKLVLLMGAGEKGFCAGADVKAAVKAIDENRKTHAMRFFIEEYALDLCIHCFPKPVIAVAHGITMGGGLGLTAGADLVIATETARMAMPETRIGFIPDVGATGWLFDKCPNGYAEYLAITGQESEGIETVRLGLSDELILNKDLPEAIQTVKKLSGTLDPDKNRAVAQIKEALLPLFQKKPSKQPTEKDLWIGHMFCGKSDLLAMITALSKDTKNSSAAKTILDQLAERSPTATVLTLQLLRRNEKQPLENVFASETKATDFIISHPDYREGVRARLLDKDNAPKWQPDTFEKASTLKVDIKPEI